jgi:MscS family membrane protein
MAGFLHAVDAADWEAAVEYLDTRNLPRRYRDADPRELARGLAVVIQRELWVDLGDLSDLPGGVEGDGLPAYRDMLGRIEAGGKEYVLLLQHVPRGDGVSIWKISNKTVASSIDLYEEFGYGPLAEYLMDRLPDGNFLGIEFFKWVFVIGAGTVGYPLLFLIGLLLARLFGDPTRPVYQRIKHFFTVPFALLVTVMVMSTVLESLGIGIAAQQFARARTLGVVVTTWVLLSGTGLVRDIYAARLERLGKQGAVVLLRPATNAIKILIVLFAGLVWLDNVGFNITTLLAGLGVGGVAVALALQKPLEDVFGALSLYTQQPIRIGDFCRIGEHVGTVEEIGLRTTRLRTLEDTVLAIPNSKLSTDQIDNYSVRQKILYRPRLRLRYDTTDEQLQQILDSMREMLATHEHVIQDAPRVRFIGFGEDALIIEIFAYVATNDYARYLELAEDLNLKVLAIISSAGTNLALPAQTMHIEGPGDSTPSIP